MKERDTVILMGAVESLSNLQITDDGVWTMLVETDFPDSGRDHAILRNGFVTLREGTRLFAPANTTLFSFDTIHRSALGHLAQCLRVSVGGITREALYWNTVPIALDETPLESPLVGLGTAWERFDIVRMTRANEVFVIGDIVNPAVTGQFESTLCKFTLDELGNVQSTEVLLTKGMSIPALGTTILDLGNGENSLSVNEHGDHLTLVLGLGSLNALLLNGGTIVAQEGLPSPVPGRTWETLRDSPKLWLNDNGEYIHAGLLTGDDSSDYLIAKNGQKFAQSGDVIPAFSASPLVAGSPAPLIVANDGNVFWRAESSEGDRAFLRDFTPFLRAGTSDLEGDLILSVDRREDAFSVSSNGRFFAGRVNLEVGGEAALYVDFGLVLPIPGCSGNQGQLKLVDGLALAGDSLTLAMDRGQAAGALPIVLFSSRERLPGSDCGVTTPFGELLISTAHRVGRVALAPWDGTQPSTIELPIPPDLALVDQVFFAQGFFRDVSGSSAPGFALTNALRIEIGAP